MPESPSPTELADAIERVAKYLSNLSDSGQRTLESHVIDGAQGPHAAARLTASDVELVNDAARVLLAIAAETETPGLDVANAFDLVDVRLEGFFR